jgi:acyl-[acyl-carrier-protein] desaturase
MKLNPTRIEVMKFLSQKIDTIIDQFLKNIDTNWQPSDFLPESNNPEFTDKIKEIQKQCKELPYDYMAVLVGDVITEEALPTYET